jgi:hypothetical protein
VREKVVPPLTGDRFMNPRDEYVKKYAEKLPEDQRNPEAQQTFSRLIERAAKPAQSESEKPASHDGYSGRRGNRRKPGDT